MTIMTNTMNMKRLIFFILTTILTIGTALASDGEGVTWSNIEHDFGTIHASGGKVKTEYTFTNKTSEAIAVISVTNGGCGCTVPTFPKKPIAAGATGVITITFDPSRFKGEFNRQVGVTLMIGGKRVKTRLKFSGTIIPD